MSGGRATRAGGRSLSFTQLGQDIWLYSVVSVRYFTRMTAIAEQLDRKLVTWKPETAAQVERLIGEIIEWTDSDALDLIHSRQVEQEVLDLLDEN